MRPGRPRVRRSLEREFWSQVPRWESWAAAGAAVGVSHRVAARWVAESGGVKPRLCEPSRTLSYRERCRIEDLLDAGWSQAEIARDLGRHRSTIAREVARNRSRRGSGRYRAENAQSKADARARRPKPARLATSLPLRREVQDRLCWHHSPEQIARRLREEFPDDPEMWVSHETIYQSLYVQARGGLKRELTRHLRTGRALRKPRRKAERAARPDPGHGDDQRTSRRGRGPGRARALGGRPDPRVDRVELRGRHPGRTRHPVRDAAAPARRTHRRHRPGGDGRQDGRPCPSSCAGR